MDKDDRFARKNFIINLAKVFKHLTPQNNPIELAEVLRCWIAPVHNDGIIKYCNAEIEKRDSLTVIKVLNSLSEDEKKAAVAHEIGHLVLGHSTKYYGGTRYKLDSLSDREEEEANLFAVALLYDENSFNIPFTKMSNYQLKCMLDLYKSPTTGDKKSRKVISNNIEKPVLPPSPWTVIRSTPKSTKPPGNS